MNSTTPSYNRIRASGAYMAPRGFSLAELLAALTIGAMISVAVLSIYRRAESSTASVLRRLDSSRIPGEVLQRIAEDLDNIVSAGSNAKITIDNKFVNIAGTILVPGARLTMTRTYQDGRDTEQIFEEITWQSCYDFESPNGGLVLYRSHRGLAPEDKLLDKDKFDWERELFVPICSGVTFFKIEALTGQAPMDKWNGAPPSGVAASISFAEPYKKVDGTYDVLDEQKTTRTIALDRSRKIKFEIAVIPDANNPASPADANAPAGESAPPMSPKDAQKPISPKNTGQKNITPKSTTPRTAEKPAR